MTIHASIDYAAGINDVFAMLTNPEFQRRKIEATGALNHHVEVTQGAEGLRLFGRRTMPTERAPEAARKMLGESVLLTQIDTWADAAPGGASRDGTLSVKIEGIPLTVTGTMRLEGDATRTTEVIDAELSSRVPLVGGKIVDVARRLLLSAIKAERTTGEAWLREY